MHVSIINPNLMAQDAIGQSVLHQARFFRRRGDSVRIFTMQAPRGVTADIEELVRVTDLSALLARRQRHFVQSDLYIYHYPGRYPLIESIKGLDHGAVILSYHNVTPPELWESSFARNDLRHGMDSVGALADYADLIVADSEFNAEQLVAEHHCDPDRIRVLPLAAPVDEFFPGPPDPALLRQYGLGGREVILFIGRTAGNKRIDLLIEALPRIKEQVASACLLLVGDDSSNPAYREVSARARARADELGVAEHVIFAGKVDAVAPFFRLADVYATASLHEGFGVPLIEAMASGLPVVATDATAHPWVLDDAGILVPPGDPHAMADAIVKVLTDDTLRADLVRRGLARATLFSLDHHEAGWGRIVDEVTAWLPAQPFPRTRSIPAQPYGAAAPTSTATSSVSTVQETVWAAEIEALRTQADVLLRGYRVQSRLPVVGRLIAWLRRNLTSHLREPYVDPMFERQVAFNRHLVDLLQTLAVTTSAINRRHASSSGLTAPPAQMAQHDGAARHDVADQLEQIEERLGQLVDHLHQQTETETAIDVGQIRRAIEMLRQARQQKTQ